MKQSRRSDCRKRNDPTQRIKSCPNANYLRAGKQAYETALASTQEYFIIPISPRHRDSSVLYLYSVVQGAGIGMRGKRIAFCGELIHNEELSNFLYTLNGLNSKDRILDSAPNNELVKTEYCFPPLWNVD